MTAIVFWPLSSLSCLWFVSWSERAMHWSQHSDMSIFGSGRCEVCDNTRIIIKLQFSRHNCSYGDTGQHLDLDTLRTQDIPDSGHEMLCKVFHDVWVQLIDANWMNLSYPGPHHIPISDGHMPWCNTQQYSYLNIYNHEAFMVRLFCDQTETAVTTKFRREQAWSSCKQTQIDHAGNINII